MPDTQFYFVGTCSRKVTRFYFDFKKKKCLSFTYNGCKGNSNRFLSLAECNKECTVAPSARDASQAKSGNIRGGKKFEMNNKLRQLAHKAYSYHHFLERSHGKSNNYIIIEVVVGILVVMLLTIGFVLGIKYYKIYRYIFSNAA